MYVICLFLFAGITVDMLKQITRLSGITGEIKMPPNILTLEEQKLFKEQGKFSFETRHSISDSEMAHQKNMTSGKKKPARTMETLTNEMVSSILGAVKKINVEKVATTQSDSAIKENVACQESNKSELKKLHMKLLDIEIDYLQKAFLQFAALKTLNVLLTTKGYSEMFLFCEGLVQYQEPNEGEKTEIVKWLMNNIVTKSTQQCKLKNVSSVAEQERAHCILHLNHTKCRLDETPEAEYADQKSLEGNISLKYHNKNIVPVSELLRSEPLSPIARPSSSLTNSLSYNAGKYMEMYSAMPNSSNGKC